MANKPTHDAARENDKARESQHRAAHSRTSRSKLEREVAEREHNLDEGLEETFPASDPVSIYRKSD